MMNARKKGRRYFLSFWFADAARLLSLMMIFKFRRFNKTPTWYLRAIFFIFAVCGRVDAAPNGPTLHLDYGQGHLANPIGQFMYFVPLVSPEPIVAYTSTNNRQCARVISSTCRISGETFKAICEFEIVGQGYQRNVLDHSDLIRQHEKDLKAGASLTRRLGSINVTGEGNGRVEIEGTVTNGVRSVNKFSIWFNGHGKRSPVTIILQDIEYHDGAVQIKDTLVARVNSLTFWRGSGSPKMGILLASLKTAGAGDSAWQNAWGDFKGIVANEFIPPIAIAAVGNEAMLDFGKALADRDPTFTFPHANNLTTIH